MTDFWDFFNLQGLWDDFLCDARNGAYADAAIELLLLLVMCYAVALAVIIVSPFWVIAFVVGKAMQLKAKSALVKRLMGS